MTHQLISFQRFVCWPTELKHSGLGARPPWGPGSDAVQGYCVGPGQAGRGCPGIPGPESTLERCQFCGERGSAWAAHERQKALSQGGLSLVKTNLRTQSNSCLHQESTVHSVLYVHFYTCSSCLCQTRITIQFYREKPLSPREVK